MPANRMTGNPSNGLWSGTSLGLFAMMAWYSVRSLFVLPPLYSHIPVGILVVAAVLSLARRTAIRLTGLQTVLAFSFVCLTLQSLVFHGATEVLFFGSYLGGVFAFSVLFQDKTIEPGLIPTFLIAVVIPEFVASVAILGPQPGMEGGNTPSLIPIEANGWRISIAPWGNTIHFTGELGALILFSAFLYYWKKKQPEKGLWLAVAGLFLVIFSGSRSAYGSVAITSMLYAINRKRIRPRASIIPIFGVLLATYGANLVIDHLPRYEGVTGSLTKLTSSATDVTSSRVWLWEHHLNLFSARPFAGSGLDASMRFQIGDTVESGQIAQAACESFYTAMLASSGALGLVFAVIHLGIVWAAFKRRDLPSILLSVHLLVSTAANSTYGTAYGVFPPFVFAFLAPCIKFGWRRASRGVRLGRVSWNARPTVSAAMSRRVPIQRRTANV